MFRYLAEPRYLLAEPRLKNTGLSSRCDNVTSSFTYCFHLIESVLIWPKVILLSLIYCSFVFVFHQVHSLPTYTMVLVLSHPLILT